MTKTKLKQAKQAYQFAKSGPMGIGLKDSLEGFQYRIWVTTWVLPYIASAAGFEMDTTAVTGAMYKKEES